MNKLSPDMQAALAYARDHEGTVWAGLNVDRRGCGRRFAYPVLRALERRGLVELYTHQDGGVAARVKPEAQPGEG